MQLTDIKTLLSQSLDEELLTDKQKSVLQSSLKLFADKGFDKTTTSDIAKLAGVAEGTVYKHFNNKQNILNSILKPFIKGVIPKAANEFSEELNNNRFDNLNDFLSYIVRDRLTFAVENRFIAKIFIQELFQKPDLNRELVKIIKERLITNIDPIISNFKRNNELIDIDANKFLQYIFSILIGYIIPVILNNEYKKVNIDKISNEAVSFLMNGMHP